MWYTFKTWIKGNSPAEHWPVEATVFVADGKAYKVEAKLLEGYWQGAVLSEKDIDANDVARIRKQAEEDVRKSAERIGSR